MYPVLYILMRTDLPSMNAGKAMAQASHASNAFTKMAEGDIVDGRVKLVDAWKNETAQGFGTALVLGCTKQELKDAVEAARLNQFIAGCVLDPTYPYRVNGEIAALLNPGEANMYEPHREYTLFRQEVTC